MSRYAQTVGQNEYSGGEGLQPLSDEEARSWLETHGKTKALEAYFSEQIVDA